jgi:LacI family transcriptional regulator
MREVARLADVSLATVSAVVNGTAPVTPVRMERVRKAIDALDYHPDQVARSLKTGHTNVVGMVVPDITNPFFPLVVRAVEQTAYEAGYSIILCDSGEDATHEQHHLKTLFARRVDGVLLACTDVSTAYESLVKRPFPIVFVDRMPPGLPVSAVAIDNVDAAYQATRHLIVLGHERIAILIGNLRLSTHIGRLEGFRKAMQEKPLPVRGEYLCTSEIHTESAYQAARALLTLPEAPTAIICSNNRLLLGLIRAIREAGVACPDTVSIVGFDDNVWTGNFNPSVTAIAHPTYEIGRQAMTMLLKRIRDKGKDAPASEVVLLKGELRVRDSTAPCRCTCAEASPPLQRPPHLR